MVSDRHETEARALALGVDFHSRDSASSSLLPASRINDRGLRPGLRCRRAMLLAEVIIAVVLLAASLAVVLSMAGRSLSAQRTGEELQIAAMLLDEQLNLVLARGPDNYASAFDTEGACDAPFANYNYSLTFSGGTAGEPYTVTATVSWLHNGKLMSESVQTFIAPRLGDEPDPDRRPGAPVERSNL